MRETMILAVAFAAQLAFGYLVDWVRPPWRHKANFSFAASTVVVIAFVTYMMQ